MGVLPFTRITLSDGAEIEGGRPQPPDVGIGDRAVLRKADVGAGRNRCRVVRGHQRIEICIAQYASRESLGALGPCRTCRALRSYGSLGTWRADCARIFLFLVAIVTVATIITVTTAVTASPHAVLVGLIAVTLIAIAWIPSIITTAYASHKWISSVQTNTSFVDVVKHHPIICRFLSNRYYVLTRKHIPSQDGQ